MLQKYIAPDADLFVFRGNEPVSDNLSDHDNGYVDPWGDLFAVDRDDDDV